MRKIVAGFATSIDGFIEGPDGGIDWIVYDNEQFKELEDSWKNIDAMFHGRKTYETSLKMKGEVTEEMINPFAHMKHYVFSNTLKEVEQGYILVTGDLKTEADKIRNQPGKDIAVFGGAELVSSLLNYDMVDELSLALCPSILGKGRSLFKQIEKRSDWKVKEVKTYNSGLISITYERK